MKPYGLMGNDVTRYRCHRTTKPIVIDGRLDDAAWADAAETAPFRDMVTSRPAPLRTTGKILWDDRALYVGFDIEEPDIRGELTERDSFIWLENDVELFLGGDDCYYEFEINALGTIYEAFLVWQDAYKKDSRFAAEPALDLTGGNVDLLGGFQDSFDHPRGRRWAFLDWDFPGLEARAAVDGTINNSEDLDHGWSVEIALPWSGMAHLKGSDYKPAAGDILRMNLFRFETFEFNGHAMKDGVGWSWEPHGVYDSHVPECFAEIELVSDQSNEDTE